ncbi:MAG: glycosyltransferase [Chloroflexi bacterium]|nr:glycosyltransferase [Chloroflexota bacterium]
MKALFLCQHLSVGGAEELVLGASTTLPSVGVETGVVALTKRGPIAEEIAAAGVPVQLASGQPGPRDPAAFLRLVRLLQRERPEIVHTFLIVASIYGRLAAIMAGVPVVLAAEQNIYERKPKRHALLERALAARTYRVVACCAVVGQFYQRQVGVPAAKMAVIYNAVRFGRQPTVADRAPARAALGLPEDAIVLGTLGRLTEQKGQRTLLQAVARLAPSHPKLVAFLAGVGPLRDELEAEAERLGIGERVRFLGMRRDRDTLYAAMDIFVLPSQWEGLSLALVEAMGTGRAVVATSVGGNPEVVGDGRTGLLVPAASVDALADALDGLAASEHRRLALGAAAAAEARARFSIEQHARELAALYRQGVAERSGRPALLGVRG